MTKEQIRKAMKEQRNRLTGAERSCQNLSLLNRLQTETPYITCESLFAFVSFGTEADTRAILRQAFSDRKKVYAPRVNANGMEFYQIHNLDRLIISKFGVPEPLEEESKRYRGDTEAGSFKVMLLPGLAFDGYGNRVGYGAGYYDRYLDNYPENHFYKIAIAYDFQVVNQIEAEEYDHCVNQILTPTRVIDCYRKGGYEL